MNTTEEKLKALLEGLEVQNIPLLIKTGNIETYRSLGKRFASDIKNYQQRCHLLDTVRGEPCYYR